MALRIKKQIKVLNTAKMVYQNSCYYGLCRCIAKAILLNSDIDIYLMGQSDEEVHNLIKKSVPSFNYSALCKAGNKGLIPMLEKRVGATSYGFFWWETDGKTARQKVLDYLISELEKKL